MSDAHLPRLTRHRAASGFPPLRACALDHLARYRAAFRSRGWRVLPGLLPRYHTLVRRQSEGASLDVDAAGILAGPESARALTAVHPDAPLAVTVVVQDAGHVPLYDVWWDGIPAHHAEDFVPEYADTIAEALHAAEAHH